jgi:hypothetical protein
VFFCHRYLNRAHFLALFLSQSKAKLKRKEILLHSVSYSLTNVLSISFSGDTRFRKRRSPFCFWYWGPLNFPHLKSMRLFLSQERKVPIYKLKVKTICLF